MTQTEELKSVLKDILNMFWDMSPLEYAKSKGLSGVSNEDGERLLKRARELTKIDKWKRICHRCGYRILDGTNVCGYCGSVFDEVVRLEGNIPGEQITQGKGGYALDQCQNCTSKGDLEKCLSTRCSYHDLWMVKELKAALDATSDATEVDLEAAFGGTADDIGMPTL
jgi:hypothetical protein